MIVQFLTVFVPELSLIVPVPDEEVMALVFALSPTKLFVVSVLPLRLKVPSVRVVTPETPRLSHNLKVPAPLITKFAKVLPPLTRVIIKEVDGEKVMVPPHTAPPKSQTLS